MVREVYNKIENGRGRVFGEGRLLVALPRVDVLQLTFLLLSSSCFLPFSFQHGAPSTRSLHQMDFGWDDTKHGAKALIYNYTADVHIVANVSINHLERIRPFMISKLLPSGCKSMNPPLTLPLSGTVLNRPWSSVMPTSLTFV